MTTAREAMADLAAVEERIEEARRVADRREEARVRSWSIQGV